MSLYETTALSEAGVLPGTATAMTAEIRANIFRMTQATEDAVLRPRDTGPFPHALRAALAARIAQLNGEDALARRHLTGAGEFAPLADPARDGGAEGYGAIITFMDKVAAQTRVVEASDISALQESGVADADIVRLAELNAFVAYQLRLIAGLRLLRASG